MEVNVYILSCQQNLEGTHAVGVCHNGDNDNHFHKGQLLAKPSLENYFCDTSDELNKSNGVIPRENKSNLFENDTEDKTMNINSMLITPCSFLSKYDSVTSENLQSVNERQGVKTDLNLSKQFLEEYSSRITLRKELGQIGKHFLDSNMKQKKFMCGECNKLFLRLSTLKIHMRLHTGVNTLKCSVCNKIFTKPSGLKEHMRSHTGERPFKCSICNKEYSCSGPLVIHMRTHTGERPFKCSLCDKSFMKAYVLKEHKRLHTGERPFCCSVCNKAFIQKIHLTNHMRIHTGERPFTCSKCDKSFSKAYNLQSHMRLHS